jgi:hypothetical protein
MAYFPDLFPCSYFGPAEADKLAALTRSFSPSNSVILTPQRHQRRSTHLGIRG